MATELLAAPTRADLDARVLDLLAAKIEGYGIPRFVYLSPTRRKCREMATKLGQRRPSWRPRFFVPMELAESIVTSTSVRPRETVSPELKVLLIRSILETPGLDTRFNRVRSGGARTPLGIARHVAGALDDLTRRELSPLDEEANLGPEVAEDLNRIRELYRVELVRHSLVDPLDIPSLAVAALEAGQVSLFLTDDLLLLDGFVAPDALETLFLLEVVRQFADRTTVVSIPQSLAEHLREHGWEDLPPRLRMYEYGKDFFVKLGVPDKDNTSKVFPLPDAGSPSLRKPALRRFSDRAAEVKGIARSIKRLFFLDRPTGSLEPQDFHIIVPRIDPYYRLFVEVFPRYGIPFNITRGIPLSSIPVVALFLALMDAVILRDRPSLFRFFSSGLVAVPAAQSTEDYVTFVRSHAETLHRIVGLVSGGPPEDPPRGRSGGWPVLDIWTIDRICRDLGFNGGRDFDRDWIRPMASRFGPLFIRVGAEEDADDLANEQADLHRLLEQMWLLEHEFRAFDLVENQTRPHEATQGFLELLKRYGLERNLVISLTSMPLSANSDRRIIIEKNVKGFNQAVALLSEIGRDLEITGEADANIETIRAIFKDRCGKVMIQEAGALAGVGISQMLEIRNLVRPVVFLAGLTTDDFPLPSGRNFLLPQGPESEAFARAVTESRFVLYHVLENSDEVFFSYPESDGTDPLEISPILQEMAHRGEIAEADKDNPDADQFCSVEILEAAGRSWADGAPVPWERLKELTARLPIAGDSHVFALHEQIRRVLWSSLHRSGTEEFGPYDGMIRDEEALRAISDMMGKGSFAYSISMLNDYLSCPLAFFFKRILALEPLEEIPEEPKRAEIGSAVHEILAEFYRERRESRQGRIHPGNRGEALIAMLKTAKRVLTGHRFMDQDTLHSADVYNSITRGLYDEELLPNSELREKVDNGTDLPSYRRGMLRILADYEAKLDLPFYPVAEEFEFGFGDVPHLVIAGSEGQPIRIRGKIDRIDAYGTESLPDAEFAWIIDYKTGKIPSMKDLRSGLDLQLPVYILAVMDGLTPFQGRIVGACFISLRLREETPRQRLIFTEGFNDDMVGTGGKDCWRLTREDLAGFRENIMRIDADIRRGRFPRRGDSSACTYCEFLMICYRDEHRVRLLSRQ